jgi:leucyl aminopeptidase
MKEDLSIGLPRLTVSGEDLVSLRTPALVVGAFAGTHEPTDRIAPLDRALGGKIARLLESGDFSGKKGEVSVVYTDTAAGPERIVLAGLGKKKEFAPDRLKAAAAAAAKSLVDRGVHALALPFDLGCGAAVDPSVGAREVFIGAALGAYSFRELKKKDGANKGLDEIVVAGDPAAMGSGPQHGRIVADSVWLARDLANTPANLMTPTIFGRRAQEVAAKSGIEIEVIEKEAIERLGMGAFLGVAKGSVEPPALIVLTYLPKGSTKDPVALVGKGITFDSGGISIKPGENMDKMKTDMSGAAAVLGAVAAAARMGLSVGVVGVMPLTENMPGGSATKPGDVLTAMDGTTIEVISTDAEGRLVLADALCYVKRFNPRAVVDIATLTGSAVVALGRRVAALFSSGDDLLDRIREAASVSGELVWPMPLFPHYFDQIKGEVADLKNSAGREGGSITRAAFIKKFAGDQIPWAHLDIAGTARSDREYDWVPKGATGWGVMTLVQLLSSVADNP